MSEKIILEISRINETEKDNFIDINVINYDNLNDEMKLLAETIIICIEKGAEILNKEAKNLNDQKEEGKK